MQPGVVVARVSPGRPLRQCQLAEQPALQRTRPRTVVRWQRASTLDHPPPARAARAISGRRSARCSGAAGQRGSGHRAMARLHVVRSRTERYGGGTVMRRRSDSGHEPMRKRLVALWIVRQRQLRQRQLTLHDGNKGIRRAEQLAADHALASCVMANGPAGQWWGGKRSALVSSNGANGATGAGGTQLWRDRAASCCSRRPQAQQTHRCMAEWRGGGEGRRRMGGQCRCAIAHRGPKRAQRPSEEVAPSVLIIAVRATLTQDGQG